MSRGDSRLDGEARCGIRSNNRTVFLLGTDRAWWKLCVVCFSGGMGTQCLKVDSSTRMPILLGADNHTLAPRDGVADGDWLKEAKVHHVMLWRLCVKFNKGTVL